MNAHFLLKKIWGFEDFRPGQLEAIDALLAERDCIAVMPTGSGKSLCYQIPALLRGGRTLVVSPLIALMQDQVRHLRDKNIPAGALHSGLSDVQRRHVMNEAFELKNYILFVSPERISAQGFLQQLERLKINAIVIDEAHCICEWGSEFRPDYNKLGILRERISAPILALTASATTEVCQDIAKSLKLQNPARISGRFFRPNLKICIRPCSDFEMKLDLIFRAITAEPLGRILVYCGTRAQTEFMHMRLSERFARVGFYHAGLEREQRAKTQTDLENGRLRILCCTCAFGMGMDYPDVRLLIHLSPPSSVEDYYQEIGRAGRDGAPALILSLHQSADFSAKLGLSAKAMLSRQKLLRLHALLRLFEDKICRHRRISEYFGDLLSFDRRRNCGACDVCTPSMAQHLGSIKPKPVSIRRELGFLKKVYEVSRS